jgi:hypothetical protein
MVDEPVEIIGPDGHRIRGILKQPENPETHPKFPVMMIMCHGFPHNTYTAHDNILERLSNICSRIGVASLRFDFRGCGISDGDIKNFTIESAMEDLFFVRGWASEKGFKRQMFTSEGFGAVPAIMSADKQIESLTLLWPVLSGFDFSVRNFDADKFEDKFHQEELLNIKGTSIGSQLLKELYELDLTPMLQNVVMPSLIFHGEQDEVAPHDFLDLARAWFRNRRIEITTFHDGIHGLPSSTHRKYMYFHYKEFIEKYL